MTSEIPLDSNSLYPFIIPRWKHLLKTGWYDRNFSFRARETWVCIPFLDDNSFLVVGLLQLEVTHLRHANLIGTAERGNYLQRELHHNCRKTLIFQTLKCTGISSLLPNNKCATCDPPHCQEVYPHQAKSYTRKKLPDSPSVFWLEARLQSVVHHGLELTVHQVWPELTTTLLPRSSSDGITPTSCLPSFAQTLN